MSQPQLEEQQQMQLQKLQREVVLVGGGTGILGLGIVKALLSRNVIVVVPSRSQDQLDTLVNEIAHVREVGHPPTPVSERSAAGHSSREIGIPLNYENDIQLNNQQSISHLHPPITSLTAASTKELGHLFTILADIGDPKGAAFIKETILERFGRLDRVIAAMSRFRGKCCITTEQNYGDWETALRDVVGVHFVCVKEFLPILCQNGRGSYTFVTGRGGETCLKPELGLTTVGTGALFGLVEAIKAEAKIYKGVTVNEVRLGLRVVEEGEEKERIDRELYGEHTGASATYIGKAIAAVALSPITNTDNPPYYLYSLQEVDEVLRKLWSRKKIYANLANSSEGLYQNK